MVCTLRKKLNSIITNHSKHTRTTNLINKDLNTGTPTSDVSNTTHHYPFIPSRFDGILWSHQSINDPFAVFTFKSPWDFVEYIVCHFAHAHGFASAKCFVLWYQHNGSQCFHVMYHLLGRWGINSKSVNSEYLLRIKFMRIPRECQSTPLMINQHWFR